MSVLLAIGTRKGLWLATSADGRVSWELSGPHHPMTEVYAVGIDTRRIDRYGVVADNEIRNVAGRAVAGTCRWSVGSDAAQVIES